MSELTEARQLATTLLLAYHLHPKDKAQHVRDCAMRLLEQGMSEANYTHVSELAYKTNKEVHLSMKRLWNNIF